MEALMQFLPLILIGVIFYFLLIRPQQQRMKQHQAMVEALRRGDTVVTQGGLIGKIAKVVDDREALVEIAEGVRVRIMKQTVTEVMNKGEPASAEAGSKD